MLTNNYLLCFLKGSQPNYAFLSKNLGPRKAVLAKVLLLLLLGGSPFSEALQAQQDSTDIYYQIVKEYEYKAPGTLYTPEGDSLRGHLHYSFLGQSVYIERRNHRGKMRVTKYNTKTLRAFRLDTLEGLYFEVVQKSSLLGGKRIICQNLTPGVYGLVKLYRQFLSDGLLTIVRDGKIEGSWEYSVLLPGQEKVIPLQDLKLNPMHKKLTRYLHDCPPLAEKVAQQVEGYTVSNNRFKLSSAGEQAYQEAALSLDELRLKVYLRIAEEYNNCQ